MNFTSQICTTKEQSEQLLALGLKAETADCCLDPLVTNPDVYVIHEKGLQPVYEEEGEIPAWSLHRLIEIANQRAVSPFSSIGNLYDDIIAHIQSLIHLGYINAGYLDMDIVNKREGKNLELLKNGEE